MKKSLSILFIISALLFLIGLVSCEKETEVDEDAEIEKYIEGNSLEVDTLADGLYISRQRIGTGQQIQAGNTLTVDYRGELLNGDVFDANEDFQFKYMTDRMIEAWEIALLELRQNDNVILITHSKYAYGQQRAGTIPPNSPLVFDITIISVD